MAESIYHGTRARAIRYTGGHTRAPERGRHWLMATAKKAAEAILTGTETSSGTYILPHLGGYTFGRWRRHRFLGLEHVRWERLGERSTVQACREAFESFDKAHERRAKELNKRSKRRD